MDNNNSILQQIPIYTNWSGLTLASLLGNKSPFYIPLVKESLNSEFCRGVKWGDLIGKPADIKEYIEIDGVKIVPVYVNPKAGNDSGMYLHTCLMLEPSKRRKIMIQLQPETHIKSEQNSIDRRKPAKPKRFFFNGMDYDIVNLNRKLPSMSKEEIYNLKRVLVNHLYQLLRVDYIVTDTNNWCTESDDKKGIKYAEVLERIASYIINKGLPTKFLVLSEVLAELKRLAKTHRAARLAQNLLNDSFSPRNLIFIPNPYDDIPRDIIADPCIQKYVVKLYKEGKSISVISNDQQAMMLFEAAISNEIIKNHISPNFLSLENINQLFILLNKISK